MVRKMEIPTNLWKEFLKRSYDLFIDTPKEIWKDLKGYHKLWIPLILLGIYSLLLITVLIYYIFWIPLTFILNKIYEKKNGTIKD